MARRTGGLSLGVQITAVLALAFGLVVLSLTLIGLLNGPGTVEALLLAAVQIVVALLLIVACPGIVLGKRWGQLAGIVGFFGVTGTQVALAVTVSLLSVPIYTLAISLGSGIYLSLASEEFRTEHTEQEPIRRTWE
jgi:hypothetical protein